MAVSNKVPEICIPLTVIFLGILFVFYSNITNRNYKNIFIRGLRGFELRGGCLFEAAAV